MPARSRGRWTPATSSRAASAAPAIGCRITARLIDAAADTLLWTDTWDGSLDDVFAMQERLARVIVDALQVRLTVEEDRRLALRPIDNLHAYECYVRARQEAWRWRRDAIDHAIQLLRNGLALVGDNARLYAALGHAWLQYREAGIDATDAPIVEAEACAQQDLLARTGVRARIPAARLDPLLPREHPGSGSRPQPALQADPGNADTLLLLTNCYLISGQVSAARPLIAAHTGARSADAADPLHAGVCRRHGREAGGGDRALSADVRDGSRQPDGAAVLHLGAGAGRSPRHRT